MSDLKAKFAEAGDRETVEVPNVGTVEVRSCRVGERMEAIRLSTIAAAAKEAGDMVGALLRGTEAQGYLIAITARDPEGGALIFDPSASGEVERGMNADAFELLGQAAMRVCGLDKLAQQAAKNASGASEESSTVSPEISTVLSRNSEDGSLHLSTVSG